MLPRIAMEARVAADPELRFAQSGVAVCRLRLVSSDRKKNPNTNEWEDGDTLWLDVTCFKQLAEHVAESIIKSDIVVVTGKIRTEEWEDRETGQKRSKIAMIADTVSASLQFRTIPHGTGRATRTTGGSAEPDPFATQPQSDEPPF